MKQEADFVWLTPDLLPTVGNLDFFIVDRTTNRKNRPVGADAPVEFEN